MPLTLYKLKQIMPHAGLRAEAFYHPLLVAMDEFGITSPERQAAFLAQVAHESGSLKYTKEIASGEAYEGRKDLGNTEPGDGVKYKGRGLLQITGRANYQACSIALYADPDHLLDNPSVLELPMAAARSAGWYWSSRGLNTLADTGKFERITRKINGGLNGQEDRLANWDRAKTVLA